MNKLKQLTYFVLLASLIGCGEGNVSYNVNFSDSSSYSGKGISCNDVYITINEKKISSSLIPFGEKVYINFNNISGFNREEGKAFPKMRFLMISNNNDTLLFSEDLYKGNSYSQDPLLLSANFTAALKNKNNEKYTVKINISDNKGDGTFDYEKSFTIKANEKLSIKSENTDFDNIYIWDSKRKRVINNNLIEIDNGFNLFFEGLNGFENQDGKIFPGMSIDMKDSKGNDILVSEDIFKEIKESGVEAKQFENQLPVIITLNKGTYNNPITFDAKLYDRNSDSEISIKTELEIE